MEEYSPSSLNIGVIENNLPPIKLLSPSELIFIRLNNIKTHNENKFNLNSINEFFCVAEDIIKNEIINNEEKNNLLSKVYDDLAVIIYQNASQLESFKDEIINSLSKLGINFDSQNQNKNIFNIIIKICDKSIKLNPNRVNPRVTVAAAFHKIQNFSEVKNHCSHAIFIEPNNFKALNNMAWIYFKIAKKLKNSKDYKKTLYENNIKEYIRISKELFKRAIKSKPDYIKAHMHFAKVVDFEASFYEGEKKRKLEETRDHHLQKIDRIGVEAACTQWQGDMMRKEASSLIKKLGINNKSQKMKKKVIIRRRRRRKRFIDMLKDNTDIMKNI